ncbi:hypothetical protein IAU59_007639 [Kwoniella sp. CBS 9459]
MDPESVHYFQRQWLQWFTLVNPAYPNYPSDSSTEYYQTTRNRLARLPSTHIVSGLDSLIVLDRFLLEWHEHLPIICPSDLDFIRSSHYHTAARNNLDGEAGLSQLLGSSLFELLNSTLRVNRQLAHWYTSNLERVDGRGNTCRRTDWILSAGTNRDQRPSVVFELKTPESLSEDAMCQIYAVANSGRGMTIVREGNRVKIKDTNDNAVTDKPRAVIIQMVSSAMIAQETPFAVLTNYQTYSIFATGPDNTIHLSRFGPSRETYQGGLIRSWSTSPNQEPAAMAAQQEQPGPPQIYDNQNAYVQQAQQGPLQTQPHYFHQHRQHQVRQQLHGESSFAPSSGTHPPESSSHHLPWTKCKPMHAFHRMVSSTRTPYILVE